VVVLVSVVELSLLLGVVKQLIGHIDFGNLLKLYKMRLGMRMLQKVKMMLRKRQKVQLNNALIFLEKKEMKPEKN
jgi:hypothetical protein